jgi:dTDP-4-dehydrorhamnose reductase
MTGASGLLSSHLLSVVEREADVVALSRFRPQMKAGLRWLVCDLARAGAVADVLTLVRPEILVHLAKTVRGN